MAGIGSQAVGWSWPGYVLTFLAVPGGPHQYREEHHVATFDGAVEKAVAAFDATTLDLD